MSLSEVELQHLVKLLEDRFTLSAHNYDKRKKKNQVFIQKRKTEVSMILDYLLNGSDILEISQRLLKLEELTSTEIQTLLVLNSDALFTQSCSNPAPKERNGKAYMVSFRILSEMKDDNKHSSIGVLVNPEDLSILSLYNLQMKPDWPLLNMEIKIDEEFSENFREKLRNIFSVMDRDFYPSHAEADMIHLFIFALWNQLCLFHRK